MNTTIVRKDKDKGDDKSNGEENNSPVPELREITIEEVNAVLDEVLEKLKKTMEILAKR